MKYGLLPVHFIFSLRQLNMENMNTRISFCTFVKNYLHETFCCRAAL